MLEGMLGHEEERCCVGNPPLALTSSAPQLLQIAAVDSFKFSLQEIAVSEYAF